jgi:hypothetical protein
MRFPRIIGSTKLQKSIPFIGQLANALIRLGQIKALLRGVEAPVLDKA